MIDEKKLIDDIKSKRINIAGLRCGKTWTAGFVEMHNQIINEILKIINEQPKVNDWIRFELDEDGILVSPIPDDEQEILIYDGDSVWFDTFINDLGECYLDSNVELIGLAWMPLPEPYGGKK